MYKLNVIIFTVNLLHQFGYLTIFKIRVIIKSPLGKNIIASLFHLSRRRMFIGTLLLLSKLILVISQQ